MSPKRKHKAAIHHGEENPGVRERYWVLKSRKHSSDFTTSIVQSGDVSLIEYGYLNSKFICF